MQKHKETVKYLKLLICAIHMFFRKPQAICKSITGIQEMNTLLENQISR